MKPGFVVLILLSLASLPARSQPSSAVVSPVGQWVTIDDERNEPRSVVTIYEQGGALCARIESIYFREGEPEDPTCEKCKGERKD